MNVRGLSAAVALVLVSQAQAGTVFSQATYTADVVFRDALSGTSMTIAYDGSNYWSTSGGSSSGTREARYNATGTSTGTYAPGVDFRSIFTDAAGNVYARGYGNNQILKQTAPGVFASYLSLIGGPLDAQSSVVLNEDGEFVAQSGGTVSRWSATGAFLGSFTLSGFAGSEASYPQGRGITATADHVFTYYNQVVTAWDYLGNEVDNATLIGAGTGFDAGFSFSYANDRFFVVDTAGGNWRGFNAGLGTPSQAVPAPATLALVSLALAGLALQRRSAIRG